MGTRSTSTSNSISLCAQAQSLRIGAVLAMFWLLCTQCASGTKSPQMGTRSTSTSNSISLCAQAQTPSCGDNHCALFTFPAGTDCGAAQT